MAGRRPPSGAIFEADLGEGVALYDASRLLPTHKTRRYPKRDFSLVDRTYLHHSGALSKHGGFRGMHGSARYSIRDKTRKRKGRPDRRIRGWPGFAYTLWVPRHDFEIDDAGRLVAYRGNPDDLRTFHTGGEANDLGRAVCLQGNTSRRDMPETQKHVASRVLLYMLRTTPAPGPEPVSGHSRSRPYGGTGKPACPGRYAEKWLDEWLAEHVP